MVPDSEDAVAAIRGAMASFGAFRRTMPGDMTPREWLEQDIVYRGVRGLLFGRTGVGKTMIALYVSAQTIKRGESVVYFDLENGADVIYPRMLALGCTPDELEAYFFYFDDFPAPPTLDSATDMLESPNRSTPRSSCTTRLRCSLSAAGLYANHDPHITAWYEAFMPLKVASAGRALLVMDHINKSGDTNDPGGSMRKKGSIDYVVCVG